MRIRKKVREREREEGKKEKYIYGTYQCTVLNKHSVNIYIVILLLLTFKIDSQLLGRKPQKIRQRPKQLNRESQKKQCM